ncbi:hypothetical protein IP91_03291 [Pseudoduganella lurida]|uniref:Alpha/beta hydrolase n=1 Tax=Pseudoduganella lurida TaxID=1036180 RepID=A0A562R630_9BURK|nr:alpha/beta hydrolase [Pseudoduganella lurida]TWI64518.1 hypothetical protein IP91_03291 [Pseudoduganella lurida]
MPASLTPFRVLVAPGLDDSGPEHWQSRWQRLYPSFERVRQDDFSQPDLPKWSARVDDVRRASSASRSQPGGTLIVAHSFGCLAAVHSVARNPAGIAGLLLVAPADPDKFGVAALLPQSPLPCPTIVIASTDDPWMPIERAQRWADRWGSTFIDAGALGHINADSGLHDWLFGQQQLQTLAEAAHNAGPLSA